MYEKDKNHRMTVRFTDEQWEFISTSSDIFGQSPSDFVRMIVNVTMVQANSVKEGNGLAKDDNSANIDRIS